MRVVLPAQGSRPLGAASSRMARMAEFVLPLEDLDRTMLDLAGGKAVNLGELVRGGFRVPAGVCVTTRAYTLMAEAANLAPLVAHLSELERDQLADAASAIRE